jgi:hypothetical protein
MYVLRLQYTFACCYYCDVFFLYIYLHVVLNRNVFELFMRVRIMCVCALVMVSVYISMCNVSMCNVSMCNVGMCNVGMCNVGMCNV